MKIEVNEDRDIELSDVFNALVVRTEDGRYGICQRDGGLEVVRDGTTVYSSRNEPETVYVGPWRPTWGEEKAAASIVPKRGPLEQIEWLHDELIRNFPGQVSGGYNMYVAEGMPTNGAIETALFVMGRQREWLDIQDRQVMQGQLAGFLTHEFPDEFRPDRDGPIQTAMHLLRTQKERLALTPMSSEDANPSLREQIDQLARVLMDEFPGEPGRTRSEGAVECAIRLLREQKMRLDRTPTSADRT
jgi:hypothetical protein